MYINLYINAVKFQVWVQGCGMETGAYCKPKLGFYINTAIMLKP